MSLSIHQEDMVEGIFDSHERLLPLLLCIELAFPDGHHVPAHLRQFMLHLNVSLFVPFYLMPPKLHVGLRQAILVAPFMSMPKAPIHKDASAIFAKHNIGSAWQTAIIDTETEAAGEEKPPHHHLRLRILRMNRSHDFAALFCCQSVHVRKRKRQYFANKTFPMFKGRSCLEFLDYLFRYPLRDVPFLLHTEVDAHLHNLLTAQGEGIGIMVGIDLGKCLLCRFVKLQLHNENMVGSF